MQDFVAITSPAVLSKQPELSSSLSDIMCNTNTLVIPRLELT
jgi:hypothetical protein